MKKIVFGILIAGFAILPFVATARAPYVFDHAVAASGWQFNSRDHWNLQAINPRTNFNQGETVYMVAQTRKMYVDHRYKVELYRLDSGQTKMWEYVTPYNFVGKGWAYSNFYPYYANAAPGSYLFRMYIDIGSGWNWLATVPFSVGSYPGTPYDRFMYDRTVVAHGWQPGSSDYWNLQAVNPTDRFQRGDDVYAITVVRNAVVNYQWKAEIYRDGNLVWQDITSWRNVGSGHAFGSYYPRYPNVQPGNYQWRIYINTGLGFQLLDTKTFTVSDLYQPNNYGDYKYIGATVAENWAYSSDSDPRNIQAVNPRTTFNRGSTVYVVAKVRDVRVNHRWRIEAYRNGLLLWTYYSPWHNLNGMTWPYGSVVTNNYSSDYGNYEFRIFFDGGSGFQQVDSKNFYVNP